MQLGFLLSDNNFKPYGLKNLLTEQLAFFLLLFDVVFFHAAVERVACDTEHPGCLGDIATAFEQGLFHGLVFNFADG